ncbi:hypothetical protein ACWCYZ_42000 [Streptomyces virginiae]
MDVRDLIARPVVWLLTNAWAVLALAATVMVTVWLPYPYVSWWTSAFATACAVLGIYGAVELAPVLATSAGTRRTVADWSRERADRVADWAGWEWDEDGDGR